MFTTTAHQRYGAEWTGPEWGPAKHDPDHPLRRDTTSGCADSLALRDGDDARPDDN
ncbi:MAG TPA: hypothetical protein VNS81_09010 [Nocardioides sp.]|nr:hypothetical protein [Nocardioides sp.]